MPGEPGWIVAGDGQMMVTLGPAEFVMGTPADRSEYFPSEVEHVREIPYRYALATTEVTVTQYEEYLAATGQRVETRGKEMTPEPDCPQTLVSWFEAARYCNWLSEREGLAGNQWCYLPNRDGEYQPGMQLADDSLQRLGYRLPTEAEWEFASRAGTATSRFHGDRADLLPAYGWFQMNSEGRTWPVGLKKPNPLGFFDLYGNALEWCHDHPNQYDQVDLSPQIAGLQAQRGGHVMAPAHLVRSAIRYSDPPQTKNSLYGFRVAKTILLIP